MKVCDPLFHELVATQPSLLPASPAVSAYGLWPDLTIAYLSPGWFGFAAHNGGEPEISARWGLGADLLSGIHGPLRDHFRKCFERCLTTERPWEHRYECSSAIRFRWFHMVAFPLAQARGLVVVHSLRFEQLLRRDTATASANPDWYYDGDGIVHQCSYCRRVRRADRPNVWDWVGDWVSKSPPAASHGMCENCYGYYSARLDAGLPFSLPFAAEASV